MRIRIIKIVCRLFLPKDLWVGKHYGAYTQKYDIVFGRLDGRGVLQGVIEREWDKQDINPRVLADGEAMGTESDMERMEKQYGKAFLLSLRQNHRKQR